MYEFLVQHQLDIMLGLSAACLTIAVLLLITDFLSKRRKWILIMMEVTATLLLFFDREAYVFRGVSGKLADVMIPLSNFLVFFLTSQIVLTFNLYLMDLLVVEGKVERIPGRLKFSGIAAIMGMMLSILAHYMGLYYYIDADNVYHRGSGFLIAYIVPVICPLIQFTVIVQYRKIFSKWIFTALTLYIFVPILIGVIQIFLYGVSIVNMAMVIVSICLYFFTYMDINDTVEHAHQIEIENMQGERKRMQRLFDQTAKAFVSAAEKKDEMTRGNAVLIAETARKIAQVTGHDEDYCEKVYYAALLHDVGQVGLPDSVIQSDADPEMLDPEILKAKPLIGEEILSNITEYPYLSQGALSSHERYDGKGYPNGLKGQDIPEIARIIAVADGYISMITRQHHHGAMPEYLAREILIRNAGAAYDPEFADAMVKLIDRESKAGADETEGEPDFACGDYRSYIARGIQAEQKIKKITFECVLHPEASGGLCGPSFILFDSADKRVHRDEKSIEEYRYTEYGEVWFDGHMIQTAARKTEVTRSEKKDGAAAGESGSYEI
ncbi:MAG: HD domain-containing protein, partial [Lachnospiraceae bacterium]|nr:HD domain-containing protein [Lachnospiraceae bacterium]